VVCFSALKKQLKLPQPAIGDKKQGSNMMERLADEATHGATSVVHLPPSERFELFEPLGYQLSRGI
jgi:hypothetical protein